MFKTLLRFIIIADVLTGVSSFIILSDTFLGEFLFKHTSDMRDLLILLILLCCVVNSFIWVKIAKFLDEDL